MSEGGVLVALFANYARLLNLGNALVSFESQPEHRTLRIVLAHYLYFLSNAERCPPLGKLLFLNLALAGIRARTALMFVYTRHILLFCIVKKLFRFCLSIGCTWLHHILKSNKQSACLAVPLIHTPYI